MRLPRAWAQPIRWLAFKTFDRPTTFYLRYDANQKLYRLQDQDGEGGFSHVGEPPAAAPRTGP